MMRETLGQLRIEDLPDKGVDPVTQLKNQRAYIAAMKEFAEALKNLWHSMNLSENFPTVLETTVEAGHRKQYTVICPELSAAVVKWSILLQAQAKAAEGDLQNSLFQFRMALTATLQRQNMVQLPPEGAWDPTKKQ